MKLKCNCCGIEGETRHVLDFINNGYYVLRDSDEQVYFHCLWNQRLKKVNMICGACLCEKWHIDK